MVFYAALVPWGIGLEGWPNKNLLLRSDVLWLSII